MCLYEYDVCHKTKIAAIPIYGKHLLRRNKWAELDDFWYEASKTHSHQRLFKG